MERPSRGNLFDDSGSDGDKPPVRKANNYEASSDEEAVKPKPPV
jgi:hypothetical protein